MISTRRKSVSMLLLHHLLLLIVVATGVVSGVNVVDSSSSSSLQDHLKKQMNWVQSKDGGYFSSKIQYQEVTTTSSSSSSATSTPIEGRKIQFYANENIKEGETLIVIPNSGLLKTKTTTKGNNHYICTTTKLIANKYVEVTSNNNNSNDNGADSSDAYPYIKDCFTTKQQKDHVSSSSSSSLCHVHPPATWSDEGKDIMDAIIGFELFPDLEGQEIDGRRAEDEQMDGLISKSTSMMTQMTYDYVCGTPTTTNTTTGNETGTGASVPSDPSLEVLEEAFYSYNVRQRHRIQNHANSSKFITMIPIYDMIPHRNGIHTNLDFNITNYIVRNNSETNATTTTKNSSNETGQPQTEMMEDEFDITVIATRDIVQGEPLYASYNDCASCGTRKSYYAAHHILRDYGVVEQYPRRWNFFDGGLIFQLEEQQPQQQGTHDDNVVDVGENDRYPRFKNKLKVVWIHSEWGNVIEVAKGEIPFFYGHLIRLRNLDVERLVNRVQSDYERTTILEFYKALREALEYIIVYLEERINTNLSTSSAGTKIKHEKTTISTHKKPAMMLNHHLGVAEYDDLNDGHVDDDETFFLDPDQWDLPFGDPVCNKETTPFHENYKGFKRKEVIQSSYQRVAFLHNAEKDDTCLHLDDIIHSCASNR